jgi:hypothetical protein
VINSLVQVLGHHTPHEQHRSPQDIIGDLSDNLTGHRLAGNGQGRMTARTRSF